MTWLTEDPRPILIAGGIALAVLFVFLLKTGRGVVMLAMAGVAICMALAVLIDQLVMTDREQVENVLYQAAEAAKQNDFEKLIADYVSPSAKNVQNQARHWAQHVKISDLYLLGLQIEVQSGTTPPTATTQFQVAGKGEYRDRGGVYPSPFKEKFKVVLTKEGDRWLVTDYDWR